MSWKEYLRRANSADSAVRHLEMDPQFDNFFTICNFLGYIFNVPAHSTLPQAKYIIENDLVDVLCDLRQQIKNDNDLAIIEAIQSLLRFDGPSSLALLTDIKERKKQYFRTS